MVPVPSEEVPEAEGVWAEAAAEEEWAEIIPVQARAAIVFAQSAEERQLIRWGCRVIP
jgi:hypothetical protein